MREVTIFRPFCHDPVARDPRVRIFWKRSSLSGVKYQADLTGNEKVKLYWHDEEVIGEAYPKKNYTRPEPRAPTAMDVNLLLSLLHLAQEKDTNVLWFRSFRALGRETKTRLIPQHYLRCARDAFRLWQLLGISWPYCNMPPPIKEVRRDQTRRGGPLRPLEVVIHEKWLNEIKRTKRTAVTVQLPLPLQATPLNIILYVHSLGRYEKKDIDINKFTYTVSGNKQATKVTPYMPLTSWIVVKRWYEEHGGYIDWKRAPYHYGLDAQGKEGLVPSRTFSITSHRKPRAKILKEPIRWAKR